MDESNLSNQIDNFNVQVGDDAVDGVRMSPMGTSASLNSSERDRGDDNDLYSRPKTPEQISASLMTTSCPPSAFLTSEFAKRNGTETNDARDQSYKTFLS